MFWGYPLLDGNGSWPCCCLRLFCKHSLEFHGHFIKYGQLCTIHLVNYQKSCCTLFPLDDHRNVFLKSHLRSVQRNHNYEGKSAGTIQIGSSFIHKCVGHGRTTTCIRTTHGHVRLSLHIYQKLGLREFDLTLYIWIWEVCVDGVHLSNVVPKSQYNNLGGGLSTSSLV